jgi:flagellar protein FlbC
VVPILAVSGIANGVDFPGKMGRHESPLAADNSTSFSDYMQLMEKSNSAPEAGEPKEKVSGAEKAEKREKPKEPGKSSTPEIHEGKSRAEAAEKKAEAKIPDKKEIQENSEYPEKPKKNEEESEKTKLLIPEHAVLKNRKESDSARSVQIEKKGDSPQEGAEKNIALKPLVQGIHQASLKEAEIKGSDAGTLKASAFTQHREKETAAKLTVIDMRSTEEKAEAESLKGKFVSEEKLNFPGMDKDKKEAAAVRKDEIRKAGERSAQKINITGKEQEVKPERAAVDKNAVQEKLNPVQAPSQNGGGESDSTLSLRTIHVDLAPAGESDARDPGTVMQHNSHQLASRLQSDLSTKIVKNASIVVRSDSSGEIKVVLHPENMGRVRIQVQMEDNRIAGRIYVDNTSVKEAFEANLKNLERAFLQEGFDSAKLDVFVGGREQSHRQKASASTGWNGSAEERAAVESLAASVPQVDRYSLYDNSLIDLVV